MALRTAVWSLVVLNRRTSMAASTRLKRLYRARADWSDPRQPGNRFAALHQAATRQLWHESRSPRRTAVHICRHESNKHGTAKLLRRGNGDIAASPGSPHERVTKTEALSFRTDNGSLHGLFVQTASLATRRCAEAAQCQRQCRQLTLLQSHLL